MPQDYTLWAILGSVGPVLTYVRGLVMPEHTFPGPYRLIIEAPHSNNHKGEKYMNVRAGRSLTPPIARKKRRALLGSSSRF